MRYTAKFFRDQLPDWKRKKDSIIVRILYRDLSFYFSAFFSNLGLGANMVSYISIIIGVLASTMFLFPTRELKVFNKNNLSICFYGIL